ncbi:MAG: ABC transporter substrate-binding protein [Lautropia sp.]
MYRISSNDPVSAARRRPVRRRRAVLACALIPAIAAIAAFATSTPAFAQSRTKVVMGWSRTPDVPQIAEAQEKGLWKQRGLDVDIVPFATGRDAFEALLGGQLDYAVMAEFPAVTGALRRQKFGVLAVLSKYQALRVIAKSPAPTDFAALDGKKIGVTVGTNINFVLANALKTRNAKAELVNVAPPDLIPALVRGDIAAGALFPSAYAAAKRALGDQYQEIMLPEARAAFVLVASARVLDDEALHRKVLEGLLEGEKFVVADPKASQEVSGRYVGNAMPLETVRAQWPLYEYRVQLDRATLDWMVAEGRWLVERGAVKNVEANEALIRSVFRTAPLKSLAPERVSLD